MKHEIYSVKDELSNTYLGMVTFMSEPEAVRQFKSQVNATQVWKDNPADFSLYRLGTFDDSTGEIWHNPEKIVGGRSVLNT